MIRDEKGQSNRNIIIGSILVIAVIIAGVAYSMTRGGGEEKAWGEKGPIVIGAAVSQSGIFERSGTYMLRGYKAAVKIINEDLNGVHGRKLKLKVYDDESSATTGAKLYRKLIYQDKVDVLLGPYGSGISKAVSPVAEKAEMPMITVMTTDFRIWNGQYKKWTIQANCETRKWQDGVFEMMEKYGYSKIAMINASGVWNTALAISTDREVRERGYDFALREAYSPEIVDFTPLVRKAKESGAEVFIEWGHFSGATGVTKAMASVGYKPKLFAQNTGVCSPEYCETVGADLAEGALTVVEWTQDMDTSGFGMSNKEINQYTKEHFGLTDSHTAGGWIGVQLLYRALNASYESKGKISQEYMRDYLFSKSFNDLLWGRYNIIESGANAGMQKAKRLPFNQWQDGEMVTVWPSAFAEAEPILYLNQKP